MSTSKTCILLLVCVCTWLVGETNAACPAYGAFLRPGRVLPAPVTSSARAFLEVDVHPSMAAVFVSLHLEVSPATAITSVAIHGPWTGEQGSPPTAPQIMQFAGPAPFERRHAPLTPAAHVQLRDGHWYAVVYSQAFPGGEMRASVVPLACFTAKVDGFLATAALSRPVSSISVGSSGSDIAVLVQDESAPLRTSASVQGYANSTAYTLPIGTGLWQTLDSSQQQASAVQSALLNGNASVHLSARSGAAPIFSSSFCQRLLRPHDNYYGMSKDVGGDWLSMWSLNGGQPGVVQKLGPVYFGHPYEVANGETIESILTRFAISEAAFRRSNPSLRHLSDIKIGDTICIVPYWRGVKDAAGLSVCSTN